MKVKSIALNYIYIYKERIPNRGIRGEAREGRGGGGEGGAFEDMEFPRVLKKYHVEILGFN